MMMNLTYKELRRLLAAVDLRAPLGPRDYFLIVFGYSTGLRVSELAAVDVDQVTWQGVARECLQVRACDAKYRHSRLIPLNSLARKAVSKLLAFNQARGFSVEPAAPLFQTKRHTRMPVRTMQDVVAKLRVKAGLDFQVTPKTLRHSFASDIAQNTGNLRIVQKLLGHKRLETSAVYTHPRRDEMARAVETLAERV
jgi:integrase/recombinase XerD